MNEGLFRYSIDLERPQRRETPAVIGQKFLNTLDALGAIDSLFTPWKVVDFAAEAKLPLAAARSRIAVIVEDGVVRDDHDQPLPAWGYSVIGVTDNLKASRVVTVRADAGAAIRGSRVVLEIGDL